MSGDDLATLFIHFGKRTKKYFAWRGTGDKPGENEQEMQQLDDAMLIAGLKRIHTSYISQTLGVAAIWAR